MFISTMAMDTFGEEIEPLLGQLSGARCAVATARCAAWPISAFLIGTQKALSNRPPLDYAARRQRTLWKLLNAWPHKLAVTMPL